VNRFVALYPENIKDVADILRKHVFLLKDFNSVGVRIVVAGRGNRSERNKKLPLTITVSLYLLIVIVVYLKILYFTMPYGPAQAYAFPGRGGMRGHGSAGVPVSTPFAKLKLKYRVFSYEYYTFQ